MKKIYLIIFILLFITGCNNNTKEFIKDDRKLEFNMETYHSDNPITVGLYEDYELINTYNWKAKDNSEIAVFNVYYTNEEKLDSKNIKYNFNKYYSNYQDIDNYKIGFHVSFMVNDKLMESTILEPTTEYFLAPYIYIYLYDDINQANGAWYSHLTMDDMQDNTIFSSIKLYYTAEGTNITSPIELTVFTYNSPNDFDKSNNYLGNSKYTIKINIEK